MADEESVVDVDDEKPADQTVKKAAKHDSVKATDLEKVTDYVEEAEISTNNISDVRKQLLGSDMPWLECLSVSAVAFM